MSRQATLSPPGPGEAPPRVDILGVGISAIDIDLALAQISGWIAARERRYVCVTGVHGVMESQRDPELRRIHNDSGLTTPDGMPMVWAGRFAGLHWIRRVYGPDLMAAVSAAAAERGWRCFLYGGSDGIAEVLAERLVASHPRLQIVGTYAPPFRPLSPEEDAEVVTRINATSPDIVWVGLGTPKQERWMADKVDRLTAPALIGVGAAFDFLAGAVPQAPRWVQRSGLEWIYRMAQEPRRLVPRYLRSNPAFVVNVLLRPPRPIPAGEPGRAP